MNKKDIYTYLKYNGVYVKRNLKKLIKKYHPDLNNGDDTIMKLINEVKKELETNNVSINNNKDINNNSVDIISITSIINKLNNELVSLNKKIENGYHDEYKLFIE